MIIHFIIDVSITTCHFFGIYPKKNSYRSFPNGIVVLLTDHRSFTNRPS